MRIWTSLYAKIFGWFWLTLLVGALLVLIVTIFTGTQPLGRRWMRVTQDMYAHSAVDFYASGGAPALERYLGTLKSSSGIDAQLLDEHEQDVLGRPLLPPVQHVLDATRKSGVSSLRLGRTWTAATPITWQGRSFCFVMEVRPLGGFLDGTFVFPMLSRFALALLVAALFCMLLARHIVTPVLAIQRGALRLAAGDLRTRVLPSLLPRKDELADTARAFDQMADRIQLLIQKRQELLADVSHELRSPLTRLSVSLELVRRGETDVVPQMEADVERMNGMIGQILLLMRLDLQPDTMQRGPVDLIELLQQIAHNAEFEAQADQKRVEVTAHGACLIAGDAALLWSCFENVIRNAVRHTRSGTSVTVSVLKFAGPPMGCEVSIADHGPGVPEEAIASLCEPFYRTSEAREHNSGTGLGLSIARRIVELHGGSIAFRNRGEESGLVATLTLPNA